MIPEDQYVIYLHGFLSSPASRKAQQTLAFCREAGTAERLIIPQMHAGPAETIDQIQTIMHSLGKVRVGLIGSSLGGYYATWLAERYRLKAVVINPAVKPYTHWQDYIGQHKNYYSEMIHEVTSDHVKQLQALDIQRLTYPQNFLLLAQTGDEVLDYRLARDLYEEGDCRIQEGGNHSFENYADFLTVIFDFLTADN